MSDEVTQDDADEYALYSSQDVAAIFRVDVKTVARWAKPGGELERRNVQVLSTIGGHKRFFKEEIHQLFQLMLDGKLYNETDSSDGTETAGPCRIVGLPKPDQSNSWVK